MTTTITAATMTVTITETLTLGGNNYNSTIKKEISSIGNIHKRIYTLNATSTHTIAEFASSITNNKFDLDDTKYIRITNLDDAANLVVTYAGASVAAGARIGPGNSHLLFDHNINGAASASALTSYVDIANLYIRNNESSAVDVEVCIATL